MAYQTVKRLFVPHILRYEPDSEGTLKPSSNVMKYSSSEGQETHNLWLSQLVLLADRGGQVMYDVGEEKSFLNVRRWLRQIEAQVRPDRSFEFILARELVVTKDYLRTGSRNFVA